MALAHIHYGMDINPEEVLDRLAVRYPKRIMLINVLDDDGDNEVTLRW